MANGKIRWSNYILQREMPGVQRNGSPPGIGAAWVCSHQHWYQQSVSKLTYVKAEQQRLEDEEDRRKRTVSK
jgi:hypothetical protein